MSIHGAKALVNGSEITSNDVFVEVISKEDAYKLNKTKDGSFYKNSDTFCAPVKTRLKDQAEPFSESNGE